MCYNNFGQLTNKETEFEIYRLILIEVKQVYMLTSLQIKRWNYSNIFLSRFYRFATPKFIMYNLLFCDALQSETNPFIRLSKFQQNILNFVTNKDFKSAAFFSGLKKY